MPLALALGFLLFTVSSAAPARVSDSHAEVLTEQDQPQATPSQGDTPQVKPEVKPEEQKPGPEAARTPENPQSEAKPDQAAPTPVAPGPQSVQKETTAKPSDQASKPASTQKRSTAKKAAAKKKTTTSPSKTVARKHRRKKRRSPTTAQKQPSDPPAKVVVPHGSTPDRTIQLTPTVSQQQASTQLQNTNQLLDTTDANLKKISNRQLNATQQETVSQIRTFMEQAKVAVSAGDVQRANNLAVKAQLLSEELVKQ